MNEVLEESVKETDNVLDLANKMVEQWNERIALARPFLLKRYLKGKFALVICVRCAFSKSKTMDYCAVFERTNEVRATEGSTFEVNCSLESNDIASHGKSDYVQEAVLIPDIELVDDIDGMGLVTESFCGVVRLQKLNDLQSRFANSRFLFRAGHFWISVRSSFRVSRQRGIPYAKRRGFPR